MYGSDLTLDLTLELINEQLRYDSKTGVFWWRFRPAMRVRLNKPAGTINNGKRRIQISVGDYKANVYADKLAWILHHGPVPAGARVVHKNGDLLDDRIENLELKYDRYSQRWPSRGF